MKKFFITSLILLSFTACSTTQESPATPEPPKTGKENLIILDSPQPEEEIESPLTITGEARGYWYFEGTFPIVLTDWDGLIIAESYATAQDNWMTEEFVPFTAELTFEKPTYKNNGSLILQKDNASDLPENDDALEISIYYK